MDISNKHSGLLEKIVLISAPWPLFNRPSIQIGTLKSYLKSQFPDLKVDAHHVYLKIAATIGYQIYQTVSQRTWLAETVYGALLYPQRLESIKKVFWRQAARQPCPWSCREAAGGESHTAPPALPDVLFAILTCSGMDTAQKALQRRFLISTSLLVSTKPSQWLLWITCCL